MTDEKASVATGVKSADRLMTLLEYLADAGEASFRTIVRDLGLPNSSAHQLLVNVTKRGFIDYNESTRTYRLGLRTWEIGQAYNRSSDLPMLAKPMLDRLVEILGETVQLARLDGLDDVHLAVSESPHPVKLYSAVGMRIPAHVTALGKVLLSSLSDSQLRQRLEGVTLQKFTENTITDHEALIRDVAKVRRLGRAEDNQEYAVGCRCFAMPVRNNEGLTIAAVSVSVPTPRFNSTVAKKIWQYLGETVRELETKIGRE